MPGMALVSGEVQGFGGIATEGELVASALALGAAEVGSLHPAEASLARNPAAGPSPQLVRVLRSMIASGADPLGTAFCRIRSARQRRDLGATYTPASIIAAMVGWAADQGEPDRVVDPGAGSGRFLLAAGRRFRQARLVAVEVDPVSALCARANLAVAGLADRAEVVVEDFRSMPPRDEGRTLWIGNPPYVRHHQIAPGWKEWLVREAGRRGLPASKLAGTYVHFFLATALQSRPGDIGCFITAAEWLDVNYGSLVRGLLLDGMGGQGVHVFDPLTRLFRDAATTGAITTFVVGSKPSSLRLRRVGTVAGLGMLKDGEPIRQERLRQTARWTRLLSPRRARPDGHVELGEICRVHRGTATGANSVWIVGSDHPDLPSSMLRPAVTKGRELFAAGLALRSVDGLCRVVDLPEDLDALDPASLGLVQPFLEWARRSGADQAYLARHRRCWWSIGFRSPAPIIATYMARRSPAFVRNLVGAYHLNIAHGLYPREPMTGEALDQLAAALRAGTTQDQGRTYAGGLTKFEPKEMERLLVPLPGAGPGS